MNQTNADPVIHPFEREQVELGARLTALSAARAIASMDPDARRDLRGYLDAYTDAQAADDAEVMRYVLGAIVEVFEAPDMTSARMHTQVVEAARARPEVATELDLVNSRHRSFQERYLSLKSASGLLRQEDVANASGLSRATIQAIEAGRTLPQWGTIVKLCDGFNSKLPVNERVTPAFVRGDAQG